MLVTALPVVVAIVIFPEWLMSLFGAAFESASVPLVILAIGQLINAATGSVAYILMMTGHEVCYRRATIVAAVVNVVLGIILIPKYGAIGAAISTSASVACVNLVSAYYVWRQLHFLPLPQAITAWRSKSGAA